MPEHVIKSLENQRAEFALQSVNDANSTSFKAEYKGYVKNIPILIKTNGLGNTLAFMCSKKKPAYDLIERQFANWLRNPNTPCLKLPADKTLLEFVVAQPSSGYRHLTKELLALLIWLKRLADAKIED